MLITPSAALKTHASSLTEYEQSECLEYRSAYILGLDASKDRAHPASSSPNCGFDDDRGEYNLVQDDHIAYRYQVLQMLWSGSFGQVAKVFDH